LTGMRRCVVCHSRQQSWHLECLIRTFWEPQCFLSVSFQLWQFSPILLFWYVCNLLSAGSAATVPLAVCNSVHIYAIINRAG
jgi:hypothetical protein